MAATRTLFSYPLPPPTFLTSLNHHNSSTNHHLLRFKRNTPRYSQLRLLSMAKSRDDAGNAAAQKLAIAGGLVSPLVIGWSLYTLKTTGCGLPPGPGGSIGAVEGVSYLVVVGIVGWSLYTKAKTGSGLPSGPLGLLGAVEGLSYLSLLAIVVVFGLQFFDKGSIPGPLPGDQCFG
ncbi:hypothetical protein Nepgr_016559 [Nepenthes gracilis]|uniref:Uncharacterized protein n=1 Tax=Nepenthes gracilis TaxID=150966 RepID=A0AAD3SMY1_NEPGR|nr:hypothetical protein Nepgr_016559 [Nepenthes gracilis]